MLYRSKKTLSLWVFYLFFCFSSSSKPSFCLVNAGTHMGSVAGYATLGVPCLRLTFLYDYLTVVPPPKPEDSVFEEYKKVREAYERKRN